MSCSSKKKKSYVSIIVFAYNNKEKQKIAVWVTQLLLCVYLLLVRLSVLASHGF